MAAKFYLELGGVANSHFNRNWYTEIKSDGSHQNTIKHYKDLCNNTDFYYCLYTTTSISSNRENALYVAPLYFDIDGEGLSEESYLKTKHDALTLITCLKNCLFFRQEDISIYFSGSKGFHIVIPAGVLKINPCNNLGAMYKKFVKHVREVTKLDSIDLKIYDNRRLFRVPNSINSKTGLYKVQITEEQLREYSVEQIQKYASSERHNEINQSTYNHEARVIFDSIVNKSDNTRQIVQRQIRILPENERKLFPCSIYLLKTSLSQGNRNNILICLMVSLLNGGWPKEEAKAILEEWNANNDPPLPDGEFYRTIKSGEYMCSCGKSYGCSTYSEHIPEEICKNCIIHQQRQTHCYY